MNRSESIKISSLTFVITACCCLTLQAQPFQGWRGENRDGVYHETGLLKTWPANGPQLLWETNDAGKGYSSPVVVGDKIYVTALNEDGEKEVFSAYSLDGKKLYSVPYGTPWKESFSDNRSTPTIVGNKAYAISGMGEIVCFNTTDGSIVWSVDGNTQFGKKPGIWGTSESPLVFDNKVIYTPGGDKTTMVALDAATGKTVWQTKSLGDHSCYVSPLLITHNGKKQIVGMTGLSIIGVNPQNGDIQWQFKDWAISKKVESDGKICANTPIFKDGRLFVSNGYDQGSIMLQLNNDATGVTLLWENNDLDTHMGGQVLVNGIIYGSNWINNGQGDWVAVDWNTGATRYNTRWEGGKSKGVVITADGMLYCYDERRGAMALVNANPEKFDVVSEFLINKGDGPHWAHPVIKNGILYVRHGNGLMAYKIK